MNIFFINKLFSLYGISSWNGKWMFQKPSTLSKFEPICEVENGSWNENLHAWVAQRWHFSIVLTCRLAFTLLITVHKLHYQDSACHFSKISYYIPTSVGLQRNQIPKLFSFWIRWFHSLSFGSSGSGIPIQSPF